MRPRRFFPGFNRNNRIRGPELSRGREEEEHAAAFPARREEATRFLHLFERPNCVLLLLVSTGSTTEGGGGGEEKKTRKQVALMAARRAAVSIVRGARLVSNLTRRGARRKLTAIKGDRRFSIGALNRCIVLAIALRSRSRLLSSGNKFGEKL